MTGSGILVGTEGSNEARTLQDLWDSDAGVDIRDGANVSSTRCWVGSHNCFILAVGGDFKKYSSSLKMAKTQIAAVDRCECGLSLLMGGPEARAI